MTSPQTELTLTKKQFDKITSTIPNFASASLLFRGSEYSFKASKFHEYCDGVAPTLSIIEAEGGSIFGMYTDIPWRSAVNQFIRRHGNTFTFALTGGVVKKFGLPKG